MSILLVSVAEWQDKEQGETVYRDYKEESAL